MKKVFILLIGAAVVLFSCANPSYQRLEEIETFIQERPDSALTALSTVDSATLKTRKQRALYSLLSVMAKDKNYIVVTALDEIEPAVKWYARHRKQDNYAASLFYSGRIHFNRGEYQDAIVCFQNSREEADSLFWKAISTGYISITYNKAFNDEEELKYSYEALDLWRKYGDAHRISQAEFNLATAFINNGDNHKADSVLSMLCKSAPPFFPAFLKWAELKSKWTNPDYREISELFNTGINEGGRMSLDNWYSYAYALYQCGETEYANNIIEQLSSQGESISSCLWLGKMAEDAGNYELALDYERREKILSDSLVKNQLKQSLFKAQMEQFKLISEISSQKRKNVIYVTIIIMVLLLSLMFALIMFHRARQEHLKKEIERLFGIAEESGKMLREAQLETKEAEDRMETRLMELRREYARLYQSQFSEIGRLFDYCGKDTNITKEAADRYLKKTAEIIREINQGEERQGEFENRINRELDNIMFKLRHDFSDFKESDFLFLSYVIVGFDATTRSIILNETPNNMRVKKARLVKKILNSGSENALLYSCFLHPDK